MSTLEVPGYQPIHIERDAAGTRWLYMGSNFVALSGDQWRQFARMVAEAESPEPEAAPFDYQSEEVAEAFTEWCAAEQVEARDDQEYRWLRGAFTAGMNETARYARPEPEAG